MNIYVQPDTLKEKYNENVTNKTRNTIIYRYITGFVYYINMFGHVKISISLAQYTFFVSNNSTFHEI